MQSSLRTPTLIKIQLELMHRQETPPCEMIGHLKSLDMKPGDIAVALQETFGWSMRYQQVAMHYASHPEQCDTNTVNRSLSEGIQDGEAPPFTSSSALNSKRRLVIKGHRKDIFLSVLHDVFHNTSPGWVTSGEEELSPESLKTLLQNELPERLSLFFTSHNNTSQSLSAYTSKIILAVSSEHLRKLDILDFCNSTPLEEMSLQSPFKGWFTKHVMGVTPSADVLGELYVFKGGGHRRMVSRRWLEHGPWQLLRDETHDVSLLRFHDADADVITAARQAIPGYHRLGISSEGGYLPDDTPHPLHWEEAYIPEHRSVRFTVMGETLTVEDMHAACALRRDHGDSIEHPVERVAFLFASEPHARKHLHELWLRELECWAIVDGKEVRLDTEYNPVPEKPQWVWDVEAREAS